MILNRFSMPISILKSIWLEITTVWLWFVRKVQRRIPTKQIFHTVTRPKFDEWVRNLNKNVIWNNLYTFLFKTQNWYFLPFWIFLGPCHKIFWARYLHPLTLTGENLKLMPQMLKVRPKQTFYLCNFSVNILEWIFLFSYQEINLLW